MITVSGVYLLGKAIMFLLSLSGKEDVQKVGRREEVTSNSLCPSDLLSGPPTLFCPAGNVSEPYFRHMEFAVARSPEKRVGRAQVKILRCFESNSKEWSNSNCLCLWPAGEDPSKYVAESGSRGGEGPRDAAVTGAGGGHAGVCWW